MERGIRETSLAAEGCMNKNPYKMPFSNIYPITNAEMTKQMAHWLNI